MARKLRQASTAPRSFEELIARTNELLGGSGYRAIQFVLPVTPMPAPRPRFTRDGYAYSPPAYSKWREQIEPHIPAMEPLLDTHAIGLCMDVVLAPYKTVSTPWPKGDVDNYVKAVCDSITATKRIWKDDVQVNCALIRKRFAEDGEILHAHVYLREIL